jgi:hypothetical protein
MSKCLKKGDDTVVRFSFKGLLIYVVAFDIGDVYLQGFTAYIGSGKWSKIEQILTVTCQWESGIHDARVRGYCYVHWASRYDHDREGGKSKAYFYGTLVGCIWKGTVRCCISGESLTRFQ